MLENRGDIKKAVEQMSAGQLTLWNARLELATRVGDARMIDYLLANSPVADGSGCDCGCGGAALATPVTLPEAPSRS
jgi:hypothetical protein